jgi:Spy/CpxP family protein refolding chaperone
MSLALAAELNGYPGPLHVLELADRLSLSDAQRARTQALFDEMKREAVQIGETLIEQETELDRQFSARNITPAALTAQTDAIGATQAALRRAHLKYHLSTMEVLTPEQIRRYGELRGYAARPAASGHDGHRPRH